VRNRHFFNFRILNLAKTVKRNRLKKFRAPKVQKARREGTRGEPAGERISVL
jgi:hypothetical protein